MNWIDFLSLAGTLVFAISGVLTAIANKLDMVGSIIIGTVTALGGGTLRDILIGQTPVGWMLNLNYAIVIFAAVCITYLFKKHISKWRKSMFLFDSIGIGLFTIVGLQKTLEIGLSPIIALIMGVVSAVFGGIIRDVLTNIVPLIFRREIYATACVIGGIVFMLLEEISNIETINMLVSMSVVFGIRYFSVKYKWSLTPKD